MEADRRRRREAVLARDYNRLLDEGGNIYFLAKLFSTDGKSFLQAVGTMTGMSTEDYQAMMIAGGRSPEGSARSGGAAMTRSSAGQLDAARGALMARITAGVATSHIPALGAALDHGKTGEPYWQPVFAGYDWVKRFEAGRRSPTSSSWSTTTMPRRST